jgi:hypothetical protein
MSTNIVGGKLRPPVNTEDDRMMIEEGIRVPLLNINREVFKKTQSEKRELKLKKTKTSPKGIKLVQPYELNIPMDLIVYCKYSKVQNFKSTHSFKCLKSEVPTILQSLKDSGYILNKVYFNNKLYNV